MPTSTIWRAVATLTPAATGGPTTPGLTPDPSALPGASQLPAFANGVGWWALVAAMLGLVIGAVMWAFGHYSQNYQQAYNGRRAVLVSAVAAVLIGAAPHIISFFFAHGTAVAPA